MFFPRTGIGGEVRDLAHCRDLRGSELPENRSLKIGQNALLEGVSRVIWSPRPFSLIRLRGRVVVSMESRGRVVA